MTERLVTNKGQCVACIGCIEESNCKVECGAIDDCLNKLAKYETAEEEGRLVVLPCKVGDIVYKIMCQRDNFDDRPYRIITSVNFRLDMAEEIGKTVFLAREEAEKELRKMEGK